jgi:hypothetical protein
VQLDDTRIAVRERDYLDILDMSLHVIRAYAGRLAAAWAMGVLPVAALNVWLLATWTQSGEELDSASEYGYTMLALMIWEMPLATAPLTLYLGQAIFDDRPRLRRVVRDLWGSLGQLVWYQVVVRGVMSGLFVTWFYLFTARPYANEVILLERNPFFAGRTRAITTSRRNSALHAGMWSDLFGRWVVSIIVGLLLLGSIYGSFTIGVGVLFSVWESSAMTHFIVFQATCWLVVGYFTVVRFLSYLDLRIRREGWEVELLVRAEGARLEKQWS